MNNQKLVAKSTKTIRPIPAGDASSFIIHDNSSEIAKIIPEKYVEPLVIIARVQGFDGVDDYIIHLIKDELEMFTDTRNDLDDSFQKYMYDMLLLDEKDVPNTRRASNRHNRRDHSTKTTTTKTTKAEEAVEEKETNDDDDDGTTTEEDAVEETTKEEGEEEDEEEGEEDSK
jgi:hypothetical protein